MAKASPAARQGACLPPRAPRPRRGLGRVGVLAMACLLLAACATRPSKPPPPLSSAAAQQQQLQRETVLRQQAHWSLAGRVAIRNGDKGGSGRLDWQQQDKAYTVSLSAPVTRQSWRLSDGPLGARLEGVEGGPRQGSDAARLLQAATGWDIPLAALGDWVRGLPAPGLPAASLQFDAQGRLSRLLQDGWTIDYRWPETDAVAPVLPQRIDAAKGEVRVRLIVDAWTPVAP